MFWLDNSGSDPSIHGNVPDPLDLQGERMVELMSGAMIASPDPRLSDDVIDPFDVLEGGAQEIEDVKPFPKVQGESDKWPPVTAAGGFEQVKEIWMKGDCGEEKDAIAKWAGLFTSEKLWQAIRGNWILGNLACLMNWRISLRVGTLDCRIFRLIRSFVSAINCVANFSVTIK